MVFRFAGKGDTIVAINLIADPEVIAALNLATVAVQTNRASRQYCHDRSWAPSSLSIPI